MDLDPRVVFRTDDYGTLQRLVGVGMGAAFVPALALQPNDAAVQVLSDLHGLPPFLVGIAWHAERDLSSAATSFVDAAAAVCEAFTLPPDAQAR